jgi:hypothetical protein
VRVGQGIVGRGGGVEGKALLGEVDGAVALLVVVLEEAGELGEELGRRSGRAARMQCGGAYLVVAQMVSGHGGGGRGSGGGRGRGRGAVRTCAAGPSSSAGWGCCYVG